jgi:hypothetical protein
MGLRIFIRRNGVAARVRQGIFWATIISFESFVAGKE